MTQVPKTLKAEHFNDTTDGHAGLRGSSIEFGVDIDEVTDSNGRGHVGLPIMSGISQSFGATAPSIRTTSVRLSTCCSRSAPLSTTQSPGTPGDSLGVPRRCAYCDSLWGNNRRRCVQWFSRRWTSSGFPAAGYSWYDYLSSW